MRTAVAALFIVAAFAGSVPEAAAQDDIDCWYRDKAQEGSYVYSDYCGLVSQSKIVSLLPELVEKVYFDPDGLSCINFGREAMFWIRRDGASVRVQMWDNGCAYFREGLAVAVVDDRQVYVDKALGVALDPGFESLGAFEEGYAKVCNGPFSREENGEQIQTTGGACGMIDRSGTLVMELIHPTEEHAAFRDFRNANNHCAPPPIREESAALCHALRHAMKADWTSYSIEQLSDRWEVVYTFMNGDRERTNSIELGTEKADVNWHGRQDLRRR